jgi:N-methylhydantoinase A
MPVNSEPAGWQAGTDVGGSFTDVWLRTDDGREIVRKAPTTADVVTGLLDGLDAVARAAGLPLEELLPRLGRFGHGTTVGLNALLTGRVARTALVTTAGFGDVLEIGRLRRGFAGLRPDQLGDYHQRGRTAPLVPRTRVAEVTERVDRTGTVLVPLDIEAARSALRGLAGQRIEAVAVCLLWATENPAHERALRELIAAELPGVFVSLSHEVAPAVGEYARASTTAANASLGPVAGHYLQDLDRQLRARGLRAPLLSTTSAGGVATASSLAARPVSTLLSGPASGVVAGAIAGARLGRRNVLTMDVGGTSFDVGVVVAGSPLMTSEVTFGGVDIRVPSVDVASIGAGGGSIASVAAGTLAVGPRSAGSTPGPACYRRGGTEATATDADLLLGVIDPGRFAGGMRLDRDAAWRAVSEHVAAPLGLPVPAAAHAVRAVLDASMADLIRSVTIERGHDPREFTLIAGGGSGPSHAWSLCRELGLEEFVVPPTATAQSAFGAGTAPLRATTERTCYLRLAPGQQPGEQHVSTLHRAAEDVWGQARRAIAASDPVAVELTAAVRYRGQAHHLDVPLARSADEADSDRLVGLLDRFERDYEILFGRGAGFREAGFEVLSVRAIATARDSRWTRAERGGAPLSEIGQRDVVFDDPGTPVATPVYASDRPRPGSRLLGPCLVELPGCVVVVPPGGTVTADEDAFLHVKVGAR